MFQNTQLKITFQILCVAFLMARSVIGFYRAHSTLIIDTVSQNRLNTIKNREI